VGPNTLSKLITQAYEAFHCQRIAPRYAQTQASIASTTATTNRLGFAATTAIGHAFVPNGFAPGKVFFAGLLDLGGGGVGPGQGHHGNDQRFVFGDLGFKDQRRGLSSN